jgi:hypothetical protein
VPTISHRLSLSSEFKVARYLTPSTSGDFWEKQYLNTAADLAKITAFDRLSDRITPNLALMVIDRLEFIG